MEHSGYTVDTISIFLGGMLGGANHAILATHNIRSLRADHAERVRLIVRLALHSLCIDAADICVTKATLSRVAQPTRLILMLSIQMVWMLKNLVAHLPRRAISDSEHARDRCERRLHHEVACSVFG